MIYKLQITFSFPCIKLFFWESTVHLLHKKPLIHNIKDYGSFYSLVIALFDGYNLINSYSIYILM